MYGGIWSERKHMVLNLWGFSLIEKECQFYMNLFYLIFPTSRFFFWPSLVPRSGQKPTLLHLDEKKFTFFNMQEIVICSPSFFFCSMLQYTWCTFLRREENFFPAFPSREGKNFYPPLPKTTFWDIFPVNEGGSQLLLIARHLAIYIQ